MSHILVFSLSKCYKCPFDENGANRQQMDALSVVVSFFRPIKEFGDESCVPQKEHSNSGSE